VWKYIKCTQFIVHLHVWNLILADQQLVFWRLQYNYFHTLMKLFSSKCSVHFFCNMHFVPNCYIVNDLLQILERSMLQKLLFLCVRSLPAANLYKGHLQSNMAGSTGQNSQMTSILQISENIRHPLNIYRYYVWHHHPVRKLVTNSDVWCATKLCKITLLASYMKL